MKKADEYFGRILCRLLGRNNKASLKPNTAPENILFIKFWGMGSIILTAPAVNAVRNKYPAAKLHYLSFEGNREALDVIKIADSIITVKLTNPLKFTIDTLLLIKKLRKINFDIIYDFEFFTYYSALINRLINAKYSIGFANSKNNRSRLFTETVEFNDHIHTRDNFLNLAGAEDISPLKGETERGFLEINPGSFRISSLFKESFTQYLVINPNASPLAFERRLPREYFVKIIDSLNVLNKYNIVLTGSADETEYVSWIFDRLNSKEKVKNLAGKLNAAELFSLIKDAECLITNDSGPLHIASSLNKPVIAFFGPESPVRYGPLSSRQLVFYRALECSPCMSVSNSKTVNCIYNEPKCMTGFDADELIIKIREFVKGL